MENYDVIIVGGGPAGLSAALMLGRCRRRVLLVDEGKARNAVSKGVHGFLTRDGVRPFELRRLGLAQLRPYGVRVMLKTRVANARKTRAGFEVKIDGGGRHRCRKLILATGMVDHVPSIPMCQELYGRGVMHCPYCDGWEIRDKPVAVYGKDEYAVAMALRLRMWTRDVVMVTGGEGCLKPWDRKKLRAHGIPLHEEPIERFACGKSRARLTGIVFEGGRVLKRHSLFFVTSRDQRSSLCERLGCRFGNENAVRTTKHQTTGVHGLYVIGDACDDMHFAIVAAAEGAKAAHTVNEDLHVEELEQVSLRERPAARGARAPSGGSRPRRAAAGRTSLPGRGAKARNRRRASR